MTPATVSRTLGGLRWGLCIVVGSALACESPGAVAPLPVLPPPPPSLDLGDARGTVRCGSVAISAGPPRQVVGGRKTCEVAYIWDVTVAADDGEAMLMDLFRDYLISDWRVRRDGPGWRHNISVFWSPFAASAADSSFPAERSAMVVHACPEEERGPVLACYEDSCEVYQDPDHVRPHVPSTTSLVLRTPWPYSVIHELGEGETLRVPVSYTALRDVESATLYVHSATWHLPVAFVTQQPWDREIGPLRSGDSGVETFAVTARTGTLEAGTEEIAGFGFSVNFPSYEFEDRPCVLGPNDIRIRTRASS